MRVMIPKAQSKPRRVVFPEGEESKILRACQILVDEEIARPILLGDNARIRAKMVELHLQLGDVLVVEPSEAPRLSYYIEEFYKIRSSQASPPRNQNT